jgi:hypothetical protein
MLYQISVDFNPKVLSSLVDSDRIKYIKTVLYYSLEEWLKTYPDALDAGKQQSSIFHDFILKIRS